MRPVYILDTLGSLQQKHDYRAWVSNYIPPNSLEYDYVYMAKYNVSGNFGKSTIFD